MIKFIIRRVLNVYMPLAVTHILVPLVLADIYRDHFAKKKFPLHYVLIAGLAGLLPDIDVLFYWILNFFTNLGLGEIHRTFSHGLFFPLFFLLLYFLIGEFNFKFLKKYKLKLKYVFLFIAFGTFIHIVLDGLGGGLRPFYPISLYTIDRGLVPSGALGGMFFEGLDAILLVLWFIHEQLNHKISDYI